EKRGWEWQRGKKGENFRHSGISAFRLFGYSAIRLFGYSRLLG
ncbi:MAG: hypothetical protein ACI9NQ_001972, partial [Paracoccaceae bacterium]